MEKAIFAAGCFWGVEDAFRRVEGVQDAFSGYTGGSGENPTYKQVCTGTTGHAEAVEVVFDPAQVTYERLLEVFFKIHDATQVNRQGPDVGTQYRTGIFYLSDAQKAAAEKAKAKVPGAATEITPASTFWKAEEYHQRYFEKNGGGGCHVQF